MARVSIANPLYDVVFKFLMEDVKVAKTLIGALIGKKITELKLKNNDIVLEDDDKNDLKLYRIDFAATIETKRKDGKIRKELVTIEVQKSFSTIDLARFRKYLSKRYLEIKDDMTIVTGIDENGHDIDVEVYNPSRIIAIYILGRRPINDTDAVIYGKMRFSDPEKREIELEHKIVDALTHDVIFVQVPNLKPHPKAYVERFLSIFNQTEVADPENHILYFDDENNEDLDGFDEILRTLIRAAASNDVRTRMGYEDNVRMTYNHIKGEQAILRKQMQEANLRADEERQRADQERQRAEEERQRAEEERQRANAERQRSSFLELQLVIALNLSGLTPEQIAQQTGSTVERVSELLKGY